MLIWVILPLYFIAISKRFSYISKAYRTKDNTWLAGELFMVAIITLVMAGMVYLIR